MNQIDYSSVNSDNLRNNSKDKDHNNLFFMMNFSNTKKVFKDGVKDTDKILSLISKKSSKK